MKSNVGTSKYIKNKKAVKLLRISRNRNALLPYTVEDEIAISRAIDGYKEEYNKHGFIHAEKIF